MKLKRQRKKTHIQFARGSELVDLPGAVVEEKEKHIFGQLVQFNRRQFVADVRVCQVFLGRLQFTTISIQINKSV